MISQAGHEIVFVIRNRMTIRNSDALGMCLLILASIVPLVPADNRSGFVSSFLTIPLLNTYTVNSAVVGCNL